MLSPQCGANWSWWSKLVVVTHVCHLSSQKVESEGSQVLSHPELHSEFDANLGNMKPCLKPKPKLQSLIKLLTLNKKIHSYFRQSWLGLSC